MTAAFTKTARPNQHNNAPNSGSSNSRYGKKTKNRKRPVPQLKRGNPVFTYYVAGTDIEATKIPCERSAEDRAERRWSQSTLGSWKNPKTGRKCKVDRVRNKPVTAPTTEGTDVADSQA